MEEINTLKVAIAQISPIWLEREATLVKVEQMVHRAGEQNHDLVVFGESILPGYPFWLSLTHGSEFNSKIQKEIYAHYVRNSIQIEEGHLDSLCALAKKYQLAIYIGITERAIDRGNHSLYCSLVYINKNGEIKSVHRKLQPTYEERLTWAQGDGHGLQVHKIKGFSIGGLNCWENWMPLARTSLYAQGENLHVAVWPGSERNTKDITRFIAKESRSYVISASNLMTKKDFHSNIPHLDEIVKNAPSVLADGGSCIAGPDGEWIIPPVKSEEGLITSTLDFNRVLEERQNFDPSGHYSRPDITSLEVNRLRQSTTRFLD